MKLVRRKFLKAVAISSLFPSFRGWTKTKKVAGVQNIKIDRGVSRRWVGSNFWANRLDDWHMTNGKIVGKGYDAIRLRTLNILPLQMNDQSDYGLIRIKIGHYSNMSSNSYVGIHFGFGQQIHYKARAIIQGLSGTNGGLFAAVSDRGNCVLIDNNAESNIEGVNFISGETERFSNFENTGLSFLELKILNANAYTDLLITLYNVKFEKIQTLLVHDVNKDLLKGGIGIGMMNLGTDYGKIINTVHQIEYAGDKINFYKSRKMGPILGSSYSINGSIVRLTAQMMPINHNKKHRVGLYLKQVGQQKYTLYSKQDLSQYYTANFHLINLDPTKNYEYYIKIDSFPHKKYGRIKFKKSRSEQFRIALLGCIRTSMKGLENTISDLPPLGKEIFRFSGDNIYHPHQRLIKNVKQTNPELVVFSGDQFYETSPTLPAGEGESYKFDYLYKWYLWYWAFDEITSKFPSVVLLDDHDYYQGNMWGDGRFSQTGDPKDGGFTHTKEFLDMAYQTQSSHNPTPFKLDNSPIINGYGDFHRDGIHFALLEDRKFKSSPRQENPSELLGQHQEEFLRYWVTEPAQFKICLTQSLFACLTTKTNRTANRDYDSNGFPKVGRDRVIDILSDTGTLILSGDQHLPSVVDHDLSGKSPLVQFSGPAAGTFWQRWFENDSTDDFFEDYFGNKIKVMANANPAISHKEFTQKRSKTRKGIDDRSYKKEGYGIIDLNFQDQTADIHCIPYNKKMGVVEFEGWPIKVQLPKNTKENTTYQFNEPIIKLYPNPVEQELHISLHISSEARADLIIYNHSGYKIDQLKNITRNAVNGKHIITKNFENYRTGYYIIVIQVGDYTYTKKIYKK